MKYTKTKDQSGYFPGAVGGPTRGYNEEEAIKFVKRERERNNQDFKDQQLFDKLSSDYQSWLKENDNGVQRERP